MEERKEEDDADARVPVVSHREEMEGAAPMLVHWALAFRPKRKGSLRFYWAGPDQGKEERAGFARVGRVASQAWWERRGPLG